MLHLLSTCHHPAPPPRCACCAATWMTCRSQRTQQGCWASTWHSTGRTGWLRYVEERECSAAAGLCALRPMLALPCCATHSNCGPPATCAYACCRRSTCQRTCRSGCTRRRPPTTAPRCGHWSSNAASGFAPVFLAPSCCSLPPAASSGSPAHHACSRLRKRQGWIPRRRPRPRRPRRGRRTRRPSWPRRRLACASCPASSRQGPRRPSEGRMVEHGGTSSCSGMAFAT